MATYVWQVSSGFKSTYYTTSMCSTDGDEFVSAVHTSNKRSGASATSDYHSPGKQSPPLSVCCSQAWLLLRHRFKKADMSFTGLRRFSMVFMPSPVTCESTSFRKYILPTTQLTDAPSSRISIVGLVLVQTVRLSKRKAPSAGTPCLLARFGPSHLLHKKQASESTAFDTNQSISFYQHSFPPSQAQVGRHGRAVLWANGMIDSDVKLRRYGLLHGRVGLDSVLPNLVRCECCVWRHRSGLSMLGIELYMSSLSHITVSRLTAQSLYQV